MPIDPRIPLQGRQAQFMGPGDALSLQSLAQQVTQQGIQTEMMRQQQDRALKLSQIPWEVEPDTGLPTPGSIARLADVDKDLAAKFAERRQISLQALSQLKTQEAQQLSAEVTLTDRKTKLLKELGEPAAVAYQQAKDAGASDEAANQRYADVYLSNYDRMDQQGLLSWMTPEQKQQARTVPPRHLVTAEGMSLKDVAARAEKKVEFAETIEQREADREQRAADAAAAREQRAAEAKARAEERADVREEKRDMTRIQEGGQLTSLESDLDRLANAANEVFNHPGLKGITGVRGAIPNIPGSAAADAEAKLNTLKSQVSFSVLQTMRAMSKTGGALGNVSDAEGKRLEANLAALEKAQSFEQMRGSLKQIVDYVNNAKARLRRVYGEKWGEYGGSEPAGAAPSGGLQPMPKNRAELKEGTTYQTPNGPAKFIKWNGSKAVFESAAEEAKPAQALPVPTSTTPIQGEKLAEPKSKAERDALPVGTKYRAPDGAIRIRGK